MDRAALIRRVRSYTRDLSSSIFREIDVTDYINEGIDRVRGRIPELASMAELTANNEIPALLPAQYHYLLATFSASRCFAQDERHYQASTLMNEFETKLDELLNDIENGKVIIKDGNGVPVSSAYQEDYVRNIYFDPQSDAEEDDGVGGVPF